MWAIKNTTMHKTKEMKLEIGKAMDSDDWMHTDISLSGR